MGSGPKATDVEIVTVLARVSPDCLAFNEARVTVLPFASRAVKVTVSPGANPRALMVILPPGLIRAGETLTTGAELLACTLNWTESAFEALA